MNDRRGIWLRSAFGTLSLVCTFYAVTSPAISLGDATTLTNLTPVFVALLAPILLRERVGKRVGVGVPLSAAGVVFVLHPSFLFGGGPARTPATYFAGTVAVCAALSSAFAMMMLRKISPRETAESIALHFSLVAAGVCTLIALPQFTLPTPAAAVSMLASGTCAGLGQLAMTRAYALERAARVAGLAYLSVVVSALLGAAYLGEHPGPQALLGMALVICGGLVVAASWRS